MNDDLREDGAILIDGIQAATTHQCPHCGGHFLIAKGNLEVARRTLGQIATPKVFCASCDKRTCGRPGCDPAIACVPIEARLEHWEGKLVDKYEQRIELLQERGVPLL